jgi:hypothetical protein
MFVTRRTQCPMQCHAFLVCHYANRKRTSLSLVSPFAPRAQPTRAPLPPCSLLCTCKPDVVAHSCRPEKSLVQCHASPAPPAFPPLSDRLASSVSPLQTRGHPSTPPPLTSLPHCSPQELSTLQPGPSQPHKPPNCSPQELRPSSRTKELTQQQP